MKKNLFTAILMGAVSMILLSGCAMCRKPQLDSCVPVKADHGFSQTITPTPVTVVQPVILPGGDVLRPVFRHAPKRFSTTGIGDNKDEARKNAIVKFIKEAKCDQIGAASFVYEETVHPNWKFWKLFREKTYVATLTGIPVTLDSLIREKAPKAPEFNVPLPPMEEADK